MISKTGQNPKFFSKSKPIRRVLKQSTKKDVSDCIHSVSATCCPKPGAVCPNLKKGVKFAFKPGLHELQMTVERSVTLVSSIVVERRRCSLQVSSVARLQENKET